MPRIKVEDTIQQGDGASPASTGGSKKVAEKTPPMTAAPSSQVEQKPVAGVDQELKGKSGSTLSAFIAYPAGTSFSEQEEGENIILLLRAHVVTNVPWILVTIGLLLAPLVIFPLLSLTGILPVVSLGMGLVLTVFWYLLTFTYAFLNFLYWYFNIYLVTNERVVDVDWYSIVYRKVSSCQIMKIQDVSAVQSGVFAGVFDFGNVQIETAAEEENFEFTAVPHPQLVAKKLQEMMQEEEAQMEREPSV